MAKFWQLPDVQAGFPHPTGGRETPKCLRSPTPRRFSTPSSSASLTPVWAKAPIKSEFLKTAAPKAPPNLEPAPPIPPPIKPCRWQVRDDRRVLRPETDLQGDLLQIEATGHWAA